MSACGTFDAFQPLAPKVAKMLDLEYHVNHMVREGHVSLFLGSLVFSGRSHAHAHAHGGAARLRAAPHHGLRAQQPARTAAQAGRPALRRAHNVIRALVWQQCLFYSSARAFAKDSMGEDEYAALTLASGRVGSPAATASRLQVSELPSSRAS